MLNTSFICGICVITKWYIDRSLNKIIELERANTLKQASELQAKLQAYELQYQMPSDIFYQRFVEGLLGDVIDYFEWSVFYELWQSRQNFGGSR